LLEGLQISVYFFAVSRRLEIPIRDPNKSAHFIFIRKRRENEPTESLKHNIADALSATKAYDLPLVCTSLGLDEGDEQEAYASKYKYVFRRMRTLSKDQAIALAKQVLQSGDFYPLQETLDLLLPLDGAISAITRRQIIDMLSDMGGLQGRLYVHEFLNRIFPLPQMPYDRGFGYSTLEEGVLQHMVRNDDWSYKDFFDLAGAVALSERRFRSILEQTVHPEVRTGDDQKRFVDVVNPYLLRDGFELLSVDHVSGYPLYRIVKKAASPDTAKT
jgi:hypothetical protein